MGQSKAFPMFALASPILFEAVVTKIGIVPDQGKIYLLAVAEYADEAMNIKAAFDMRTLDHVLFLKELREKIAEGFDISPTKVVMNNDVVLGKMFAWWERFDKMGLT